MGIGIRSVFQASELAATCTRVFVLYCIVAKFQSSVSEGQWDFLSPVTCDEATCTLHSALTGVDLVLSSDSCDQERQ